MTLQKKALIAARLQLLLERSQGRLTPDVVVDDARDPTSPLHDQFEWKDDEAARLYRIDQARQLIRSVKIEVLVDKRSVSVPAYVHDPSDQQKRGYVETVSLQDDRARGIEAMKREFTRIEGLVTRSRDIATVLGLEDEFEAMLSNVIGVLTELRRAA